MVGSTPSRAGTDKLIEERSAQFQKEFNYQFNDPDLLIRAIKHCSYSSVQKEHRGESYERLEFLGDAVLDLVVSDYLYHKHSDLQEGELTKLKSRLVNRFTLAEVSKKLGLGDYILLSYGEDKSGGRTRESILADILESIVGAIYLDSGYKGASQFLDRYLIKQASRLLRNEKHTNYKGELLELVQNKGLQMPYYQVVVESGPEHSKTFTVEVQVGHDSLGRGSGRTKKRAEQVAAKQTLVQLRASKHVAQEKSEQ